MKSKFSALLHPRTDTGGIARQSGIGFAAGHGGVTIGKGCVIGAGSVVTKDIPDNTFAAGVPCRVIREITEQDSMIHKPDIAGGYRPMEEK